MADRDFLTLFSPRGALASKRVTPAGVESAPHVALHRVAEVPIEGFEALATALTSLVDEPTWYAVRGKLRDGVDVGNARRTHVGADATLLPASHQWLLLDLDHVKDDLDPATYAANPGAYAAQVRAMLPACFEGVSMWWMATGGAGFKPGVRMRVAFWLDRPLGDSELKTWVEGWSVAVDDALFTPSQPHYTSAPVFEGVADPVPKGQRCGVLAGSQDTVPVPGQFLGGKAGDAQEALAKAARGVARLDEGERRNKLNKRAYALAKAYSEGELPANDIARVLMEASSKVGLPAPEALFTLRNAIRDGRAKHEAEHAGWKDDLARDKEGEVRSTQANVTLYLEHHEAFKGRLATDSRTGRAVWVRSPDWAQRDRGTVVGTEDVARIVEWMQKNVGVDAREAWIRTGLTKAASGLEWDYVQDWLAARPTWDGTPRLSTLFIRHFGAEDTELTRAYTVLWFLQAVRRAYATLENPVKADSMLLLMSAEQGLGKSSFFSIMSPQRGFQCGLPDFHGKDAKQTIAGAFIVELAEFTQRKADADAFKAFITTDVDKFRPPYGHDDIAVPRRCVIAITTNDEEPLTDPTGNRRFWPIVVSKRADFAAIAADRDQVWAEAIHYVRAGVSHVLPEELTQPAAKQQAQHKEDELHADAFRALAQRDGAPTSRGFDWEPSQIEDGRLKYLRVGQACAMVGARVDRAAARAVSSSLREAGWVRRQLRDGSRAWYPPEREMSAARVAERMN